MKEITIKMDEDIFIDYLWERVKNTNWGKAYDDDFWAAAFEELSNCDWFNLPVDKMRPDYIIDNIGINADVVDLEDCSEDDILDYEEGGYPAVSHYFVRNWGL